jgi:hypothetical protein
MQGQFKVPNPENEEGVMTERSGTAHTTAENKNLKIAL